MARGISILTFLLLIGGGCTQLYHVHGAMILERCHTREEADFVCIGFMSAHHDVFAVPWLAQQGIGTMWGAASAGTAELWVAPGDATCAIALLRMYDVVHQNAGVQPYEPPFTTLREHLTGRR